MKTIATLEDYNTIRELVADILAENIGASVSPFVRETVAAVKVLECKHPLGVPAIAVGKHLRLDKGATSRRLRVALEAGYIENQESRKYHPMLLKIGEPLPAEREILPHPSLIGCTVARLFRGIGTPLPPPPTSRVRRIHPVNGGQNEA